MTCEGEKPAEAHGYLQAPVSVVCTSQAETPQNGEEYREKAFKPHFSLILTPSASSAQLRNEGLKAAGSCAG